MTDFLKWLLVLALLTFVQSSSLVLHGDQHTPGIDKNKILTKDAVFRKKTHLRLDLWYISDNNGAQVDLLCHGNDHWIIMAITCPAIDDNEDISFTKFNRTTEQMARLIKEQQKEGNDEYTIVTRTVSKKAIGNKTSLYCICQGWLDSKLIAKSKLVKVEVPRCPKMKTIIRKRISSKKYIQLKCEVSGGPILHVDWYKDGTMLKLYGKTSWIDGVEYQKGKHGLKINRSNTEGSGNYTCFAWNMAGEIFEPSSEVTIYGIDRCLPNPCHPNATCVPKNDSFICLCNNDFSGNKMNCTALNAFHNSTGHGNVTNNVTADFVKNICHNGLTGNDTVCQEEREPGEKSNVEKLKQYAPIPAALALLSVIFYFVYQSYKKKKAIRNIDQNGSPSVGVSNVDIPDQNGSPSVCVDVDLLDQNGRPSVGIDVDLPAENGHYEDDCNVFTQETLLAISNPAMKKKDFTCNQPTKSTLLTEFDPNPPSPYLMRPYQSLPTLNKNEAMFQEINEPFQLQFDERPHSTFSCDTSTDTFAKCSNEPKGADPRYIASEEIGHEGGQISLKNIGIKLIIPEGALPQGKNETIYVRLMENDRDLPHLEGNLSLISPVVMCGPPGLKFEKPVMLIFPHCAAMEHGISGFQIISSETNEEEEAKWESIFNADKEPSDECFCSIVGNMCYLFVSHFTKYGAVCECKGKAINILAYSPQTLSPKEYCNIRVYIFPNSEVCRQRVKEDENELSGTRCDAVRSILFKEDGGGLCLTIKDIDDEWKNLYENIQHIGYEEIWNCMSIPVSITFTLKRKTAKPEMFSCRIDAVQEEIECQKISTIHIQVGVTEQVPGSPRSFSSGYASGEVTNESCIPAKLRTQLSHALDGESRFDGKDWRMLAEKLKVPGRQIKWLIGNTRIDKPTEHILQFFETEFSKESIEKKLYRLADILNKMGRNDAAELISIHLSIDGNDR